MADQTEINGVAIAALFLSLSLLRTLEQCRALLPADKDQVLDHALESLERFPAATDRDVREARLIIDRIPRSWES